jgi:hypothetical protein
VKKKSTTIASLNFDMASRIDKFSDFDLDLGKGIILNLNFSFQPAHPTLHADLIRRDTSAVQSRRGEGSVSMNSEYGEETKDNPYSTPSSKEISLSEDVSNLKDTMEQMMEEKLQY